MKRKVSAANLSIAITFLLILLSFGFGYRSYSQAEQRVVSDLNQALQRTVLQHKGLWLNADTIQTYAKLQEVMGTPVSVSGFHRAFTEALSITGLKDVSTLSLHILKKNAPATVFNEIPAGCLASDTLVWLSTTADASGLTLSFRGYARCSAAMLFSLSKQTIPATLLLAALLWGGFTFFYFHRHTKTNASNGQQQENFITFGNLSLSLQEACFYNEQQEKLKLTPHAVHTDGDVLPFFLTPTFQIRHLPIAMAGKRQCRRNALHIDTASEAHCRGQQQPQNNNRSWPRLRTGNKNLNIIES